MPRPDRSRDALLSTTVRLLRRQGYAATGLAQILAESRTTAGSLYHHFPGGKEALAEEALTRSGNRVAHQLTHLLDAEPDLARALGHWFDLLAATLTEDPLDGCFLAPAATESVAASATLRAAARRAFASWQAVIAARLRADGRSPGAAATEASAVLSLIEGAILLARTSGDTEPLRAAKQILPRMLDH